MRGRSHRGVKHCIKYLFLLHANVDFYSHDCGFLLLLFVFAVTVGETDVYNFLSSLFCSSDLNAQPLMAPFDFLSWFCLKVRIN